MTRFDEEIILFRLMVVVFAGICGTVVLGWWWPWAFYLYMGFLHALVLKLERWRAWPVMMLLWFPGYWSARLREWIMSFED